MLAMSSNRSDMRSVIDMHSSMIAISMSQATRPIHEDCDGSCTGQQIRFAPLLSSFPLSTMTVTARQKEIPTGCVLRHTMWMNNQNFTEFDYHPLSSSSSVIRLLKIKPAVF